MDSNDDVIKMGTLPRLWNEYAKTVTFCVTEDCQLACKYCYLTGKNTRNKMTLEVGKQAVDYILDNREIFKEEAIVWEFIGGEPFLEIKLIDEICDYIKIKMYKMDHPWFKNYRFSFSTNGVLYDNEYVQKYIKKNLGHLSIGISVDGNKAKHDLQRVKLDGSGSYDDVIRNVPLWQKQFPGVSTKATFSHDDLPYLKDSIISLWSVGIKMVMANVIFEDVWYEGDDLIFENQLKELADYIIENGLWKDCSVRFFTPDLGFPLTSEDRAANFCGAGFMLAIDYKGDLYPCIRFMDFSLSNKKGIKIGDIYNGINSDKLRPFLGLSLETQSKEECINCEVASGCAWCSGCNYDCSEVDSIYDRATYICKMHKANVRANEYFWDKFAKETGLESRREKLKKVRIKDEIPRIQNKDFLIMVDSEYVSNCVYPTYNKNIKMTQELFDRSVRYALINNYRLAFVGDISNYNLNILGDKYLAMKDNSKNIQLNKNDAVIFDNNANLLYSREDSKYPILLINKLNIGNIACFIQTIYSSYNRVDLILQELEQWDDEDIIRYSEELDKIMVTIKNSYKSSNKYQLNVMTDILSLNQMCNCNYGMDSFAIAPNGKIYICPAFYFYDEDSYIGNLENGIKNIAAYLLEYKNAPICNNCDVYHCKRCKYLNKKLTNEVNTPPKIQCTISHIEREKSMKLQITLKEEGLISKYKNEIHEIDYQDPLEIILKKRKKGWVLRE